MNETLMLAAMEFALYLRLSNEYLDPKHAAMGLERLSVVLSGLTEAEQTEFLSFLNDQASRSTGRVAEVITELPQTLGLRKVA